ncbi:EamA family transporter [Teichococcus aestuarii]|uniref:EamA family transporter n=1 Tax=Teichococcus aestuarii TaxID=568898 RepID=UPI0036174587
MPLADATAVNFASPLFTVALAAIWLKETVSPRRWLGVAVGLLGVAVALRPPFLTGGPMPHGALLLPLGTALLYGVYQILTRRPAGWTTRAPPSCTPASPRRWSPRWRSPSCGSGRRGRSAGWG